MPAICQVKRLGLVGYSEGVRLQNAFAEARKQSLIHDQLFFLEHPHVITFGRNAKKENLTASPLILSELGVEVHETGRGGDVTYHGPGQVVGYPIINLAPDRCDVHRYVRDIEEVMIRTAADYDIEAHRIQGLTGIWVGNEKLAAIGVRISRWVTMHGFAFNANTNLDYFKLIVPCGISDKGVTSLQRLLGRTIDLHQLETRLAHHFGEVFEREMVEQPLKFESVQVVIYDEHLDEYLLLKRTPERGGFWQPVTGRIKRHENPAAAAVREALEETGLQGTLCDLQYVHSFYLEPHLMKRKYKQPQVNREYSFALKVQKAQVRLSQKEHSEYQWLKFDEALSKLIWNGNRHAFMKTRR